MVADIIVIAIVALFVSGGYRKGLVKTFMGMISYILAIVVAFLIYPAVSDFLAETPLYPYLVEKTRHINVAVALMTDSIVDVLMKAISFILVIVISRIIICVVTKILDIFTKLPVIKHFNRLGGALIGGLTGILVLYIVFAAVAVYDGTLEERSAVVKQIHKSSFAEPMYKDNILLKPVLKGGLWD